MEILDDNTTVQGRNLRIFLQAISLAAFMQVALNQIWKQKTRIVELPQNTSYVEVKQDKSHLVGMPFVESRLIPVKFHIYIDINSKLSPYTGGWLFLHVFDPETKQLFYWITEMVTVYQRGIDHDFTQAGQLGRIGFFNASGRGGVGVTSTCN